jgi:hypothetical protein
MPCDCSCKWLPSIYHFSWIRVNILTMSWNVLPSVCITNISTTMLEGYMTEDVVRTPDLGIDKIRACSSLVHHYWHAYYIHTLLYILVSGKLSLYVFSLSWSFVICYCWLLRTICHDWQQHLGCSHGQEFFLQPLGWSCSINVAGISKKLHFVDNSYKKVKPDLRALISHIFLS